MGWEEDVYMYVHTKHRLHVVNEEIWKTWREGIMEISRERLIRKGIRGDYCSRNFFEIYLFFLGHLHTLIWELSETFMCFYSARSSDLGSNLVISR